MSDVTLEFNQHFHVNAVPELADGSAGGTLDGNGLAWSQSPNGALGFNGDGTPTGAAFTAGAPGTVTVTASGHSQDGTPVTGSFVVLVNPQPVTQAAKLGFQFGAPQSN